MARDDPKTEWERIAMFGVLADDYFAAKEALGFPDLGEITTGDLASKPYWLQQMQGMMLRKFFAPSDSVQIPKVAAALLSCSADNALQNVEGVVASILQQFEQAEAAESANFKQLLSEGGDDAFSDLLYGRLLHANSAKFRRTQKMTPPARAMALFIGTADLQKAIQLTRCNINICLRNGWIMDRGTKTPATSVWPVLPAPSS